MRSEWRENFLRNLSQAESLSALITVVLEAVRQHGAELQSDGPEERSGYTALIVTQLQRLSKSSHPHPRSETDQITDVGLPLRHLIALGDMLLVRTDATFRVAEVFGDTERLLGITAAQLMGDPESWRQFLPNRDMRALQLMLRSPSSETVSTEIAVRNPNDGRSRRLLVTATSLFGADGELTGYVGVGLDITERHESRQQLLTEQRRLNALYEVSRAVQATADPAMASLRGIRALRSATSSDCALACFYDDAEDRIELVAAEGFSEQSVHELSERVNGASIARAVIAEGRGFAIQHLESDPRNAAVSVTRREGLRSAIFAPLEQDGRHLGCIALFSQRRARYQPADLELLTVAVQQLSLAITRAEVFAAELRQANVAATLYQLSHELSRLMTAREMASHAFPIIQGELACKRMWLGILNDQGSHLVGQAGSGPGVRRSIIDLQINLSESHEFLDQAIRSKEPVVVPVGAAMECSTLNRLITRLDLGMLVIVPLVSLGRTVGILLLEPSIASAPVVQRKLPLLKTMAGEIATIILARRFEGKMAESEKMRMAAVLASGVAHNFNNLLQAVMGQASLIEMQLPKDSKLAQSTQMILESATKGAALIKQLMSFSMQGGAVRKTVSVNSILSDSKELYHSVLGSRTTFALQLAESVPPIYGDQGQLQQVITNLLMNAREAVGDRKNGQVTIATSEVRVRPGELDPELAPGLYVRVEVQDNGVGMNPDQLARCFEPFYTTKDLDVRTGVGLSGSGLGLSSSYSIVKQHEGLLTARSQPGEGTTFSVYLPALTVRSEEQGGEGTATMSAPPVNSGPADTVLLVGLRRTERELCAQIITAAGRQVEAVPFNEQLLAKFADKVTVVVTQCPDRALGDSGIGELASALRRGSFNGQVVAVSDSAIVPNELAEFAARITMVSPGELGAAVERVLRGDPGSEGARMLKR